MINDLSGVLQSGTSKGREPKGSLRTYQFVPKSFLDMNIKGLLGNAVTTTVRPTEKVDRAIKSDMSHDRDANGQQMRDENPKHNEPMSEEMLEQSMETLRQLPAIKEHNWTVELMIDSGKKFVVVKDNLSNTIRRIPELEMWTLPFSENANKGNLLKKTA